MRRSLLLVTLLPLLAACGLLQGPREMTVEERLAMVPAGRAPVSEPVKSE